LLGVAGIVVILGIAILLSTNRRAIRLRVVGAAFALQAFVAWLVLYTNWGRAGIQALSGGVGDLLGYATEALSSCSGRAKRTPSPTASQSRRSP
jgi:CNT family concentrative nucleoside transporter